MAKRASSGKESSHSADTKKLLALLAEKDSRIEELNRFINAFEKVDRLTDEELIIADKKIKSQEQLTDFSIRELQQRDISMRNVLMVSKTISSILEKEKLLETILESLISSLQAQRGVLYINRRNGGLLPEIFKNITILDTKRDYFRYCLSNIIEAGISRKSIIRMMEEIQMEKHVETISFLCLPLLYEENLLGVIYVDIISSIKTFRVQDLDIAEIFSSQAAISIHNSSLYERIHQQNLELMKLVNLKDQFVVELSRNIKGPMSRVRRMINELESKAGDMTQSTCGGVSAELEKMEATLDKFLTLQELEKEVEDLYSESIRFTELFEFILNTHHEEAEKRALKINVRVSPQVEGYHGNRTIMRTIFDELISNAIFYNRQNGTVDITASRKGDGVMIVITDTGHGIRQVDQDRIFEQFYRTEDSPELNRQGAGLGLFMVKKFLKYYNGTVHLESEYGKGSTFTVTLMAN